MPLPALSAVAVYAGLNGLVLAWLALNVVRVRRDRKVFMGDGGDPLVIRAMRGQANFVEFVPMTLLLIAMAALLGAPTLAIHALGVMLTLGRVLHAVHFVQADAPGWQRGAGAALTLLTLLLAALGAIAHGLMGLGTGLEG
ncbi:MAPEG family protein [Albimonas sp. CAU 1670]|uniref:MAPEG family protein n=1 Tax=Albimonas sp. CAU 1670 TaxID=3032599 RepID=UPI0023DB7091|nr:MAPEG family protein [Albimonas sp. CAU 1670]MDF2232831.1 MAPEG family protein [Albimonas sp. CAU 1670]